MATDEMELDEGHLLFMDFVNAQQKQLKKAMVLNQLSAYSIKELKAVCKTNNIDISDCLEKTELVIRIIESEVMVVGDGPKLDVMPSEIITIIFKYLTSRELVAISMVCTRFRLLAVDDDLWRHHFHREWKNSQKITGMSWRHAFILKEKELLNKIERYTKSIDDKNKRERDQVAKRLKFLEQQKVKRDRLSQKVKPSHQPSSSPSSSSASPSPGGKKKGNLKFSESNPGGPVLKRLRYWKCTVSGCNKDYITKGGLTRHLKEKHQISQ